MKIIRLLTVKILIAAAAALILVLPSFSGGYAAGLKQSQASPSAFIASPSASAPARPAADKAVDRLKNKVVELVAARLAQITGETKKLGALLAAGFPAIAGNDPAAETPYSRSFFKEITKLYSSIIPVVMDAVPVSLEVEAADEFYADGFFMDTDNPPALVNKYNAALAKLIGAGSKQKLKYRVCALSDDGLMAFAKGGQTIVLSAGFAALPAGEMTAAIAHELAHLECRHFLMYRIVDSVNKILVSRLGLDEKQAALALNFAKMRFYRQLEYEADSLTLKYLRVIGFQPDNLERLLVRLLGASSEKPRLGDDHPTIEARLKAIGRHLKR